jgi:hypothetical protein
LYPLLPVLDEAGRWLDIEPFGVYEELERLEKLNPACQIKDIPLNQLKRLLEFVALLAEHPLVTFHLAAYRVAKQHVFERLRAARKTEESAFAQFEWNLLHNRLFDYALLRAELSALADRYAEYWGNAFQLPSPTDAAKQLDIDPIDATRAAW